MSDTMPNLRPPSTALTRWATLAVLVAIAVSTSVSAYCAARERYDHREQSTTGIESGVRSFVNENIKSVADYNELKASDFGRPHIECPDEVDQSPGNGFTCFVDFPKATDPAVDKTNVSVAVHMENRAGAYTMQLDY